jgi:hypothetical protein
VHHQQPPRLIHPPPGPTPKTPLTSCTGRSVPCVRGTAGYKVYHQNIAIPHPLLLVPLPLHLVHRLICAMYKKHCRQELYVLPQDSGFTNTLLLRH